MRTGALILAGVLAAAVSAQDIPESCLAVTALSQKCSPDSTDLTDIQSTKVAQCICDEDANFDTTAISCIDAIGAALPEEVSAFFDGFKQYCALFAGGGGGGSAPTSATRGTGSATITPTPTATSDGTDSENCQYIVQGLSSCWTDDSPLPTAAPVAKCLCSGTSFDAAIEGCYSDIVDSDPTEASTIAAFAGFCSKFSAGAFSSGPTTTDDGSEPTTTGGSSSPDPTSADEDATSTGRVIQTLDPTTTGTGTNSGATGTDTPNSAAGFKVTILGGAIAAILASAALVL